MNTNKVLKILKNKTILNKTISVLTCAGVFIAANASIISAGTLINQKTALTDSGIIKNIHSNNSAKDNKTKAKNSFVSKTNKESASVLGSKLSSGEDSVSRENNNNSEKKAIAS